MKTLVWDQKESRKSSKFPAAREGHTFLYMPDLHQFILFGGMSNARYQDVYFFDPGIFMRFDLKIRFKSMESN